MVKIIKNQNKKLYQCGECGFKYAEKEIAERCQVWCKKHKSCNLEIIKYAEKTNEKK
ncbi:MAG: hypothetical protein HYY86_03940 [Candidatus Harrisonbacteria bacterium]|nr:hypothetical protein [Candidatus Harrisonbacteria bacterium]